VTDPDDTARYTLKATPTVRRQLSEELPESVAAAALEFITGPLLDNPQRVGKPLAPPLQDRHSARRGTYRIVYRIDDDSRTVTVLLVSHRKDAYRPR
jgi:mRNA-degrading endonuclease RelE of RelBE toxin-antitoxin system